MSQDSNRLSFTIEATASEPSRARATRFKTLHGEVTTPVFMPVGTQATVKTHRPEALLEVGSQVLLANTYHLLLRPGPEVFRKMGGIHKFMNWPRSVLTDSGGFQIFSLPEHRNMTDEGAGFRSHLDGKSILLTPELSIDVQIAIGSDIMMVLDECVPSVCDHKTAADAMVRTHKWAKRSFEARGDSPQALFGIIQGACFEDLRRESAAFLSEMPFDGLAIGGLAVGETREEREHFSGFVTSLMPTNKPRYLMGVGTPIDLLEAVHRGVDMFDCILPTALAQQGVAYTSRGRLRIGRHVHETSSEPMDPECGCYACKNFSRAYMHHLIKAGETLGWSLVGHHNLAFFHKLTAQMRKHILEGTFYEFYKVAREELVRDDIDHPVIQTTRPAASQTRVRGQFEIVPSPLGFHSIRHKESGETMHSVSDPAQEAFELYVRGSQIVRRMSGSSPDANEKAPLDLWDVGLGAGTNAMVLIQAIENVLGRKKEKLTRPLRMTSFEIDMDAFLLARERSDLFSYLRHRAPTALLETGEWKSEDGMIEWKLIKGDFLKNWRSAPTPELVFFDPFSSKSNPEMWSHKLFTELRESFETKNKSTWMFTYSSSTAIRASLLASGFWIAKGFGTGPKVDTTVSLTQSAAKLNSDYGYEMLDKAWLEKWMRSSAAVPADLTGSPTEELLGFRKRVSLHPQFSG